MAETSAKRLILFDPTVGAVANRARLAPRLDTLQGKVIGLLDNTKGNSDNFLAYLGEELAREYGVAEFLPRRKRGASSVASAEILDELAARCDGVITGVGD